MYARVSSSDQNTDIQKADLLKKYPDGVLREETASGTNMDRPMLGFILDIIREDDKLVVWKLDRLARSIKNLMSIVDHLESRGATLEILDQNIDTSSSSGRAFLQMLGVFAEFETNLRRERQLAGIIQARKKGRTFGRKPALTNEQKKQVKKDAICTTVTELAIKYGVSRGTIYNIIKAV